MGEDQTIVAKAVRRIILDQSMRANVGHIGSALSIADILVALFWGGLRAPDSAGDRDRFILSKGHASLALFAVLFLKGWIAQTELDTFCGEGSLLGVHPERGLPGIDFSTGSLGLGLSYGAGSALAAKLQGSSRRVFVLLSDAECNEGAVWEAVMFASHHQLSNLIAIVDLNGQQALGYTRHVLDLSPMDARWRAFGWDVHNVEGHDIRLMTDAMASLNTEEGPPHVLIAHTVFGKGVSFMEGLIRWHYSPLSEQEYRTAIAEIGILP